MIATFLACLAISADAVTVDTKAVQTIFNHKSDFTLEPGSKSAPRYFNCRIPSNSPLPIPVKIRFKSYVRNKSKLAPDLEQMLLIVNSSHSKVYDSYNLQRIEDSPFGFKCSVKDGLANFSLEREGGKYDNKGTIEATVMRMPEKVTRTAFLGDVHNYSESYTLFRKGDYPVGASMSRKVGPAQAYVPTWLTITLEGKQIYHQRSGSHNVVLHVNESLEKGAKIEIKLYTGETYTDQKPKVTILCFPTLAPPTFG